MLALSVTPAAASLGHFDFGYTTASTSPTTGALINPGGLGNAGAIFGGDKIVSVAPTAGIGYATGSGGGITQATSKSTGVTLNKVSGAITMNGAALAAGATVGFTMTNSTISATDVVLVSIRSGGTANSYHIQTSATANGSCVFELRNTSGGSLSEALVINFVVIKAVQS